MDETAGGVAEGEPTQKKSRKKWWIIGTVIVLFLCLAVTAVATLSGLGIYSFYKTVAAPVGPIKDHLAAVNDGDYEKAYSYCSNKFKKETSYDEFVQIVEGNPQIFKSKKSSFGQIDIKNGIATVNGSITGKDGTVTPMVYQLVKEEGKWKILYFSDRESQDQEDEGDDI